MVFIYCRGFRLLKIGCGRISHQVLTIFSHSNFSNPHSHSSFLSPCLLDQKKKRVLGRELGKEKSKKLFRRVWFFVVASHILLKCAIIFYSSRPLCWKHNSSTGTWNGNVEPGATRDKSMLFEGCWSIIANFWQTCRNSCFELSILRPHESTPFAVTGLMNISYVPSYPRQSMPL